MAVGEGRREGEGEGERWSLDPYWGREGSDRVGDVGEAYIQAVQVREIEMKAISRGAASELVAAVRMFRCGPLNGLRTPCRPWFAACCPKALRREKRL